MINESKNGRWINQMERNAVAVHFLRVLSEVDFDFRFDWKWSERKKFFVQFMAKHIGLSHLSKGGAKRCTLVLMDMLSVTRNTLRVRAVQKNFID